MKYALTIIAALCVPSAILSADDSSKPVLVGVQRIWDEAPHNAFTDLIRFKDRWYCVFREGKSHVSPDGALRVITSVDGKDWESTALITSENSDLRDAKITVTPDGRLMLAGAEAWNKPNTKFQSLVWFSSDGKSWSERHEVGVRDNWLWRITWYEGKAYGFGYDCGSSRGLRQGGGRGNLSERNIHGVPFGRDLLLPIATGWSAKLRLHWQIASAVHRMELEEARHPYRGPAHDPVAGRTLRRGGSPV